VPRFSAKLMDHFNSPRNAGRLEAPDLVGVAGVPNQGPFTRLEMSVRDGVILAARFQTHGCGPAIACGSALTELLVGRSLAEARDLKAESIVEALDGVPDDKRHCADTAVAALADALKKWSEGKPGGQA
jgi:NifU-like protein involved in Fe-S cluster formation